MREGVVFEGPSGWGEFAPFRDYEAPHTSRWLAAALESAFGSWPIPVRSTVPINAIIPAVDAQTAAEMATEAITQRGITTIKVKVANSNQWLGDDISRVSAIREVLDKHSSGGKIRIDANGAWLEDEAVAKLAALDAAAGGLDYVEQPMRTLPELISLRSKTSVRIAVDENIRLDTEISHAQIRQAADLIVIKAIPFGGVRAGLDFVERLELPTVVSGSLDTYVGLSSGLAIAGALPELAGACGLGTGSLFASEIVGEVPQIENGELAVTRYAPDAQLLARAQNAEQTSYWQERIRAAWEAGAKDLVSPEVREAVEIF